MFYTVRSDFAINAECIPVTLALAEQRPQRQPHCSPLGVATGKMHSTGALDSGATSAVSDRGPELAAGSAPWPRYIPGSTRALRGSQDMSWVASTGAAPICTAGRPQCDCYPFVPLCLGYWARRGQLCDSGLCPSLKLSIPADPQLRPVLFAGPVAPRHGHRWPAQG